MERLMVWIVINLTSFYITEHEEIQNVEGFENVRRKLNNVSS
jgi:hypothetical protein